MLHACLITSMRYLKAASLLLALTWLVACSSAPDTATTAARPAATKMLRVGMSPDYPPMAYVEDGVIKGMEVELAGVVAAHMGMTEEIVPMPWNELIPALLRGDVDVIMSGMTVTEGRSELVAFSDSYMTLGQMAIIRIRDAGRFRTPMQALESGARVGFVNDTTGQAFVDGTSVIRFKQGYATAEQGLDALNKGQIDIFIHDAPTSWDLAVSPWADTLISMYRPLTEESLAWAVRQDDKALLEGLNETLAGLKASGRLESMQYRWIPVQVYLK